jgi:hypothetical protein
MTHRDLRGTAQCSVPLPKTAPRCPNAACSSGRSTKLGASGAFSVRPRIQEPDENGHRDTESKRFDSHSWIFHQDISIWQRMGTFLTGADIGKLCWSTCRINAETLALSLRYKLSLQSESCTLSIGKEGRPHGRPATVTQHAQEISSLFASGTSKRQIASKFGISRSSVRRMLVARRARGKKIA